jgi:4,5-DOPA dioxygenase extradiol
MDRTKAAAVFIGHGSPMNAIEDNDFTRGWEKLSAELPRPEAVLAVSAHWYVKGSRITDAPKPKMVYDMYGFPQELYQLRYEPAGSPETAREAVKAISIPVTVDNGWGLDHGAWSALSRMYPKADIPVLQLSVDSSAPAETHYRIGRELGALRDRGVMILGSGNVVHNLGNLDWYSGGGAPWADEFDAWVSERVRGRLYSELLDYGAAGRAARLSVPTPDHYFPLLYVLGASREDDALSVANEARIMGSLSMTCYSFS